MRFERMTQIYSRLVDNIITNTNEINDFSVGSAIRSITESLSIEIEQFHVLTQENIKDAIEEGVYSSFGFERKKSLRSRGDVRLYFNSKLSNDAVISKGTQFSSSNSKYPQRYETLEDYVAPEGALEVDVEVFCTVSGSVGNVPAETINTMTTPIANLDYVSNPNTFQTGADKESMGELRSRFRAYIESLSKATVPALEYGTRDVRGVSGVYIDEDIGLVTIYAHNENGDLPDDLRDKIIDNLENYRPAGIQVEVEPVKQKQVDIDVEVLITDRDAVTNNFRDEIKSKIERYLDSMKTSQDLVFSDLSRVIMNIDKYLIYSVSFNNLDSNINLKGNELIRSGDVKVNLKYKK